MGGGTLNYVQLSKNLGLHMSSLDLIQGSTKNMRNVDTARKLMQQFTAVGKKNPSGLGGAGAVAGMVRSASGQVGHAQSATPSLAEI